MPISAVIQRILFKDKDGGGHGTYSVIVRNRFLSYLIWQFIQSSWILLILKTFFMSPFTGKPFTPTLRTVFSFVAFHFSLLLASTAIFFISSPLLLPFASPLEISLSFLRIIFVYGGQSSLEMWRKVRVSLSFVLFASVCALTGALLIICICGGCDVHYMQSRLNRAFIWGNLGFRGFMLGLLYGLHYVYKQRWLLRFPIIQRPPFFRFKMGLPLAFVQTFKFSAAGFFPSALMVFFLPSQYRIRTSVGGFFIEQIVFYIGSFLVVLCLELSHHLHQVLHTKRSLFAPSKGSAAAETNPSKHLLATLEESSQKSLLEYLAYLDLCMICESNVNKWRRGAFFEETGDTYKRIIAACMAHLENFNRSLSKCLERSRGDNPLPLSYQLSSSIDQLPVLKLSESFYDSQLTAWCARIVSSLTVHSRKEDRYGVAQLSGCNVAIISTLLSTLLAVETLVGKKTNLPSTHNLGLVGIKWATVNTGRRESAAATTGKIRGGPIYAEAYSLADTLRCSLYSIVSAFHDEMLKSAKSGLLAKDWITSDKPLYGTPELLVEKLRHFLDFQA